ncbi:MAG TPA: hypothetical protein VK588_10235 [Chitinophagaceae bacterium]|nr:hypothetical protein [Chitinophagaceae bacterium]
MSTLIPLQQAVDMTTLYRNEKENILDPAFRNRNILCNCETFERADFDTVLAQPDCVNLRVYYGMDKELEVHAIIVGVNSKDEDILPQSETEGAKSDDLDTGGKIIEEGIRCPPTCPSGSPLIGG